MRQTEKFIIKETKFLHQRNKGLFASIYIQKGEIILQCTGKKISFQEAVKKEDRESDALQIGDKEYIDFEEPGVIVNHSCDPNAGINENLELIAIKDISPGEEIKYAYSTTMDEDHWTMKCLCQKENCRFIIRDFKYLPEELKSKYLTLGIVLPLIANAYLR